MKEMGEGTFEVKNAKRMEHGKKKMTTFAPVF